MWRFWQTLIQLLTTATMHMLTHCSFKHRVYSSSIYCPTVATKLMLPQVILQLPIIACTAP
jgi:hypothetical protein